MKKADIIRGLKADLSELEEAKGFENIDYQRGKIDQLRSLIKAFQHPVEIDRYKGMLMRLPSRAFKITGKAE